MHRRRRKREYWPNETGNPGADKEKNRMQLPDIVRNVIKTKWHHVISIRLAIVKKSGSTNCYHILARETVEVQIGTIPWEGILGTLVKLKIYIPYSLTGNGKNKKYEANMENC